MRNKDYIDSLNLDIRNIDNIETLLVEYEKGKINREEYLALTFLSHSQSYSRGFQNCYENNVKTKNHE